MWPTSNKREREFVAGISTFLKEKRVLVLGSSPNPSFPDDVHHNWTVISVNASGVVAKEKGLQAPSVAVFAVSSLLKSSPHIRVIREKIKGLRGDHVIVRMLGGGLIKRSVRLLRAKRVLRQLGYDFSSVSALGPKVWNEIVRDVMGEDSMYLARNMSTGLFCIVLAIHAKAEEIAVSGIDPTSTGHQYSSKGFERQHVNSDKRMLDFLVKNYPVKVYLPD